MTGSPTVGALRRALAARLHAAGIAGADLDARLLLAEAIGCAPSALLAEAERPVTPEHITRAEQFATRRAAGEPVARILGRKEFWSLDLSLGPDTLVPRPDTETLVDAALAACPDRAAPLRVLDLGTGTGALLAAVLVERPAAWGVAVDRAPQAAEVARDNLARSGLGDRAAVMVGDWADALTGRFDLVVSNPPYIPTGDLDGLDIEVRAHDPRLALDGGRDGLDAYRAICRALPALLTVDGVAVLELGIGQEADVARLLEAQGLAPEAPARADLGGIPRALMARRRPTAPQ